MLFLTNRIPCVCVSVCADNKTTKEKTQLICPHHAPPGWSFPQAKGQYQGCLKRRWHYSDGVWVKIRRGVQISIKKIIYMWKIVTLVPEIRLSPLDGISLNRMLWKKNSDEWKFRQGELVTGRNLFILVSFLVRGWMMVRYTLWCHSAGLDDLSAVANSTTEHHAEDHPDDLQKEELTLRQQQMWIITPPPQKKPTVFWVFDSPWRQRCLFPRIRWCRVYD